MKPWQIQTQKHGNKRRAIKLQICCWFSGICAQFQIQSLKSFVHCLASVGCSDAAVCCKSQEYWSQSKDKTQTAFLASVWETDWCTVLLNTRMLVIVKTQESWSQSKHRPYLCSPRTQVDATHTSWAQIQRNGTSHVCFSKEDTVLPASPQEDFSKANFPPGQLQRREAWFCLAKKCRSIPEQCHCHTEHRTAGHKYNIRFQSGLPSWPAGTVSLQKVQIGRVQFTSALHWSVLHLILNNFVRYGMVCSN